MSLCCSGMFKRGEKHKARGRFHFLSFQQAQGGGRMLPTRQFWGNHFWRELILGGGRGCFLTANALLWFPFLGTLWFPWQQRSPASKVLLKDQGLACDAPSNYPRPRLRHAACRGGELSGRGAKMSALQNCGHWCSAPPPPTCASSYSSPDLRFPGLQG